MKDTKERTTYLCPKCDKEYFGMERKVWESDRVAGDAKAKVARNLHKCPWELRKLKRKGVK